MSNLLIQNLINKLKTLRDKSYTSSNFMLNINSTLLKRKQQEILSLVSGVNYNNISIQILSIYFQSTNLSKFTKQELELLLKIDYSNLENNSVDVLSNSDFDFLNPPLHTSSTIYNFKESSEKIKDTHSKLLSINKTKSFNFFIDYIISQL